MWGGQQSFVYGQAAAGGPQPPYAAPSYGGPAQGQGYQQFPQQLSSGAFQQASNSYQSPVQHMQAPAPHQHQYQQHQPFQQPQAPQQQYFQASPTLPPQAPSDPDSFAAMYHGQLSQLTFNSKPIITGLTILAHEHAGDMANVIAQVLDEHISAARPEHRLPALYLLDSISKNVGAPYTTMWSERISALFLETYRIVDQPTKMRMEELLATWRNSGPGKSQLFGPNAQWEVERTLFGNQGPPQTNKGNAMGSISGYRSPMVVQNVGTPQHFSGGNNSPMPHVTGAAPVPDAMVAEKQRGLELIDRLLALGTQLQYRNPAAHDQNRMTALRQLKSVLQSSNLTREELGQITAQLEALSAQSSKSAIKALEQDQVGPGADGSVDSQLQGFNGALSPPHTSGASAQHQGVSQTRSPVPASVALPASFAETLANLGRLGPLGGATPPHQPSNGAGPAAVPAPAAAAAQPSDLIRSLMQAGLIKSGLSATATPPHVISTPPHAGGNEASLTASATAAAKARPQDWDYESAVLSLSINLSGPALQKEPNSLSVEIMTSNKFLPLQCRQCSNRYPAGDAGQKSMDEHLDWHFRHNRRAKEMAARGQGQSRSWLSRIGYWIRGGFDDSPPTKTEAGEESARSGGLTPAQQAELRAAAKSFVVAPSDDPSAATRPCPICKELFKSEWNEDEEEWIWKDATKVDGVYYHATCRYSAKALSSTVGARGASPQAGSNIKSPTDSRDATPEMRDEQASGASADPVIRVKPEDLGASPTSKKRKDNPNAECESENGLVEEINNHKRLAAGA
ncbi:mRNA cleavage and polyadenylation factor I/II complex, subunit Pcf11 [Ceraceosorus bombacis]|uniref:mRNA cleavage and polyadenylation factor I/II complex, subunit Pcf11 n=1 Tax=Ceraceosorus bombacis TaxID=401625 RepID=A0A0P1BC28_9BASI|nr:mRNA cleavage and polyadenylation factor I/II complex, subunit Pcf11 [Ceraceosorus bombacis]